MSVEPHTPTWAHRFARLLVRPLAHTGLTPNHLTTLRLAIVAHAQDGAALLGGEVEMDEAYFGGRRKGRRGRGAAGRVPVFGILERGGAGCNML